MSILSNLLNPALLKQEVIQAPSSEFWFTAVIAIGLASAGFYFAFVYLKRARIIEDTPTSKIRSAAQGYVELVGNGDNIDGPPIVAPLSNTACTWYRYKVEKLGEKHDRVVDSGISDELFALVGETGRCVIDPEGASVTPSHRKVWHGSSYSSSSMYAHGGTSLLNRLGRRYRFTEERMHAGDPLYAIGFFRSVGGANQVFDSAQEIKALLQHWKKSQTKLLDVFDKNKDGQIDAHEWENVRRAAKKKVREKQLQQPTQPVTHIMSKPQNRQQPYLLSTVAQHQIIKRYKLYSVILFIVFVIVGAFTAWMFLLRF